MSVPTIILIILCSASVGMILGALVGSSGLQETEDLLALATDALKTVAEMDINQKTDCLYAKKKAYSVLNKIRGSYE